MWRKLGNYPPPVTTGKTLIAASSDGAWILCNEIELCSYVVHFTVTLYVIQFNLQVHYTVTLYSYIAHIQLLCTLYSYFVLYTVTLYSIQLLCTLYSYFIHYTVTLYIIYFLYTL